MMELLNKGSGFMDQRLFPLEPAKRKVILVLSKIDIQRCYFVPNAGRILLNNEMFVLQAPVHDRNVRALSNIMDSGLANPGTMLIQNPYDTDLYEEASIASERFAIAKHMIFSTFCMYLGAKEVSVAQIEINTVNGRTVFEASGNRLLNEGKVKIDDEKLKEIRKQIQLRDEFVGGEADTPSAEKLLRDRGLLADFNMRSLLTMRTGPNPIKTRTLNLNLSSEAKGNLTIAGKIQAPTFINLSADYSRILSEQYSYNLKLDVRF